MVMTQEEGAKDKIGNDTTNVSVPQQEERMTKILHNWTELIKMPTIGPFHAFFQDFTSYAQDLLSLSQTILYAQTNLNEYWKLINMAYVQATKEVSEKAPKKLNSKEDFEQYRNITINAFEDAFTNLFSSKEFSVAYGKVSSDLLDLFKKMQKFAEKNLKVLNLPTRDEMDQILKDIHDIKRTIHDIKKSGL
ncbi:MAG TPA: poly(R)-hydroxyalkanoic acid synthase subunit PhaE [Nitrososphaeraceae archaeon]|nr:poly(R)-hydroxyalkanoic acid synthase subunit PhaE [Nitrososphaeraceae archaeon]